MYTVKRSCEETLLTFKTENTIYKNCHAVPLCALALLDCGTSILPFQLQFRPVSTQVGHLDKQVCDGSPGTGSWMLLLSSKQRIYYDVQNDMTAERQLFFHGAWLGASQLWSERMGLGSSFTCSSVEQWDSVAVWMAGDSIFKSCTNKSASFTRNQCSIVFMFATGIHRQLPCTRYMNRSVSQAAPF